MDQDQIKTLQARMWQLLTRLSKQVEREALSPNARKDLKDVLDEVIAFALSNHLDPVAEVWEVEVLRQTAREATRAMEDLPPESNLSRGRDDRGDILLDNGINMRRVLADAHDGLPGRVQPARAARAGKRKTRKSKGKSRRARYSRRR